MMNFCICRWRQIYKVSLSKLTAVLSHSKWDIIANLTTFSHKQSQSFILGAFLAFFGQDIDIESRRKQNVGNGTRVPCWWMK